MGGCGVDDAAWQELLNLKRSQSNEESGARVMRRDPSALLHSANQTITIWQLNLVNITHQY